MTTQGKPCWDYVPDEFDLIAQFSGGGWWAFKGPPKPNDYGWEGWGYYLCDGPRNPHWRDTLEPRPTAGDGVVTFDAVLSRFSREAPKIHHSATFIGIVGSHMLIDNAVGGRYTITLTPVKPEPAAPSTETINLGPVVDGIYTVTRGGDKWHVTSPGIDYRTLLTKYIQRVEDREGVNYIDWSPYTGDVWLTKEEQAALQALKVEGDNTREQWERKKPAPAPLLCPYCKDEAYVEKRTGGIFLYHSHDTLCAFGPIKISADNIEDAERRLRGAQE